MLTSVDKKLWLDEFKATYKLAWPLILAQLLNTSLTATDVVMMGWLGPIYLAAGGTAASFYLTLMVFGFGTVGAVAPLVAQALGAKRIADVRRTVRQGMWIGIGLAVILHLILTQSENIFLLLKQTPETATLAGGYLDYASWSLYPVMIMIALRSFLSAHDDTKVILLITLIGFFINLVGNYALMFGNWGFPRLELVGAGITTSLTQFISTALIILYIVFKTKYRHYNIFVRLYKPDWDKFFEILRIGIPVGFTIMFEVGLFSAAYFLMGMLSTTETAAHAIALQIASIAFMIPFGLSFATTVRVGLSYGKGDKQGIALAGWVSIILSLIIMSFACAVLILFPTAFIHLFLDPTLNSNMAIINFAISYLIIAAIFQLVDGLQVVSAAALRGLNDTKIPMYITFVSYWLVGLPLSYVLAFTFEMRGQGVWIGLASSIGIVAICLLVRFIKREKLGLMPAL